jgi:hypothetical protein
MNPYLKNLSRIEFVVTMACTGQCKHCSQGEYRSTDNIDKSLAADAVRKIADEYKINSLMTFGGEPLLYPDTVCAIHKAATEVNIPHRQLITNGFFSKDSARIKEVALCLAKSGVNDILLSVDAFHQETIPLEYIKAFAEAVKTTGINIKVHPAWLVSAEDDNPYNICTRELLTEFYDMGISANEGNVIFPAGNALKYLGDYLKPQADNENPYWEDPEDIKAICFSANGDILGSNIYKDDIGHIISSYRPQLTSET